MIEQARRSEGERIRTAREARGWTQKDLAEAAGVAPNTVGSIERGERSQAGKLTAVRNALNLDSIAARQAKEGYPPDVEIVRDALGLWLMRYPEQERPERVARVIAAIVNDD